MKKVRCINLSEKRFPHWSNYFKIGDEVALLTDFGDFYKVCDPKNDEGIWYVDKECFEEVCDE